MDRAGWDACYHSTTLGCAIAPNANCFYFLLQVSLNVLYNGVDVSSSGERADGGLNSIFSNNLIHGGQSVQEKIVLWLAAHSITLPLLPAATRIHKAKWAGENDGNTNSVNRFSWETLFCLIQRREASDIHCLMSALHSNCWSFRLNEIKAESPSPVEQNDTIREVKAVAEHSAKVPPTYTPEIPWLLLLCLCNAAAVSSHILQSRENMKNAASKEQHFFSSRPFQSTALQFQASGWVKQDQSPVPTS